MPYQIIVLFNRWEKDATGNELYVIAHTQVLRFKKEVDAEVAFSKLNDVDCSAYRLYEVHA